MVRNDLFITMPTFFKCPISLDVMKSPVSLSTGVTYDRSSIQAWLDNGNNTCPATMQVLPSKDFVPNHNLHRLIQIWSSSQSNVSPSSASSPRPISRQQAMDLIMKMETRAENCFASMSKIIEFAKVGGENRKFLADIHGFVPFLVDVVSNVNGQRDEKTCEQMVRVLDMLLGQYRDKDQLIRSMARNRNLLASVVVILKKGHLESRIASARVLGSIATDPEFKLIVTETEEILTQLVHLVSSETDLTAMEAGLSCLITVSGPRRIKVKMVRLGLVEKLGKRLPQLGGLGSFSMVEKILKLLEIVSTCTDGRTVISSDPNCLTSILEKMLKVSKVATEHGVVILWSVCYLYRDQTAQETVMKSNGLTKLLLIMQSNCSPSVRQMCGDLMKIFRGRSGALGASLGASAQAEPRRLVERLGHTYPDAVASSRGSIRK